MTVDVNRIRYYYLQCARFDVPERSRAALCAYLVNGRLTGAFLAAMLANDFVEAACRADDANADALPIYARFLANVAPQQSWGSPEKVNAWVAGGGETGRKKTAGRLEAVNSGS